MALSELVLVLGLAVVLVTMVDALWTTLWVDGGAGPVSRMVMRGLRAFFGLVGGRRRPRLRSVVGPSILTATLVVWIALLWVGWLLVFAADAGSLVQTSTRAPATLPGRAYFVGYTIFTMGNGDFTPQGAAWQLATAAATGTGLVLITLGITYLISVLGAQVDQRATAAFVLDVADDPVRLARALRTDGTWPGLHAWVRDVASRLGRTTEQHLAYPVLHFLVSGSRAKSPALAVAVLDEALTILRLGLRDESRPRGVSLDALEATLASYAKTMEKASHLALGAVPAPPALAALAEDGADVVTQAEFESRLAAVEDRRRRLLALVESSGWTWPGA